MLKIILDCDVVFIEEAKYVFQTYCEILNLPHHFLYGSNEILDNCITVYYGKNAENENKYDIRITSQNYADFKKADIDLTWFDDIPILYANTKPCFLTRKQDTSFIIYPDIICGSFYLLSVEEELDYSKFNEWGSFSGMHSIVKKLGINKIPVLNIYIKFLKNIILDIADKKGLSIKMAPLWKENKKFAVALTHDVDKIKKYEINKVFKTFIKSLFTFDKKLNDNFKFIFDVMKTNLSKVSDDPYLGFYDFINLERFYNTKSSFFFLSESTNRCYDPVYNIRDEGLEDLLKVIYNLGWEIGLHASYESYNRSKRLVYEKDILCKILAVNKIRGVRQHYLRFSQKNTWQAQYEAGFEYDSTLGFNEIVGFRAGIAFPFFPYDRLRHKSLPILELPLAIMDGTLFQFMNLSYEEAFLESKKIIDIVERYNGLLVLLWHTHIKDNEDFPGWWKLYHELLEYISTKDAWVSCGSEISDWWLKRIEYVRNLRDS